MCSRNKRRAVAHRGVAVVETAIMLPAFVLLVLGAIEICSMIFLKQSLEIAAYEGARTAIVPKSKAAHAVFAAETLLANRSVVGSTVTVTPNDIEAQPYGTIVKVSISTPCDANALFTPMIFAGQTMVGEVEMMKEQ